MKRLLPVLVVATLGFHLSFPPSASADIGDISVGGVWVCRLTRGVEGLTLQERVRHINRRMADVLSLPETSRRQITVVVQTAKATATIVVADIVVMSVTPEDAVGSGVPPYEIANQWAARLVVGLRRALPGRDLIARMYAPPPPPPEDRPRLRDITWYWHITQMNAGSELIPDDSRRYTVRFLREGAVAVRADCNRGVGAYARRGRALTMSIESLTRAACAPGSAGRQYLAHLNAVTHVSRRGHVLTLGLSGRGAMRFSTVASDPRDGRVTGTVTYRQRVALPPDAIVTVQLRDTATDTQANVLGQQTIVAGGRQVPLAFEIKYDSRRINPRAILVVRAAISVGGMLLFVTPIDQRVITGGYPSEKIEAVLEPVK